MKDEKGQCTRIFHPSAFILHPFSVALHRLPSHAIISRPASGGFHGSLMSLDRSLKSANSLIRHRNVLTRTERLTQLTEEEK
ncbi:MAG TPA: hypothetical protein VKK61_02860, partial [Tepidisphaeraceae bacterium]|nr:hypothetical protein [Tepidisphaeraceae bacterium]